MSTPNHRAASPAASDLFDAAAITAQVGSASRPKHLKLSLKPQLALILRRAREAANASQTEIAHATGSQQPQVAAWESSGDPHSPTALHVATGPRAWAERVVRWQAQHHRLQVLVQTAVVHGDNHAARIASLSVQFSDPLRVLATAVADGELTEAELEAIAQEAREAAQAALELEAWAVERLKTLRAGWST